MKKWCALLAGTFGLDLALRWQGHLAAPLVPGVPLWAGLQLVSTPATGLHLTSLGAVSSAAVLLSLALLAAVPGLALGWPIKKWAAAAPSQSGHQSLARLSGAFSQSSV